MFRWLIQEPLTTRQIVKRLNALQIPTRTGQNPVWHVASVRYRLSNPIYTGEGHYKRTKSGVPRKETRRKFHPRKGNDAREPRPSEEWVPITAPALISAETFAKAQEQLKQNQGTARRAYQPTSQRYLLRTLVRCGQCQLHMQAARQLSVCKRYEYLYYCCAGKAPLPVGRVERCVSRRVRADRLDTLVWTLVRALLQDPQVILQEDALWQHVQQGQQGQFQEQLDRIDAQRHNLERQLQRLIDAYQQEIITLQDLSTRREQITQRLKGFAQERKNVEQQRDTTIKWEHIADHIGQFRALLGRNVDQLRFEDRQAVVQLLVEKVVVHPDGAVEVHHVLPFEEAPVAADQKKKGIPGEFYVLRLKQLDLPARAIDIQHICRRPSGGVQRGDEQQPPRHGQGRRRDGTPGLLGFAACTAPGAPRRRGIELGCNQPHGIPLAGPTTPAVPLPLGATSLPEPAQHIEGLARLGFQGKGRWVDPHHDVCLLAHRRGHTAAIAIAVTDCNRNWPGLQSARFWDHIHCLYRHGQDHIICH